MKSTNYVTGTDEVLGLLQTVSDRNIPSVRGELRKGDLVSTYGRRTDDYWLIDDSHIHQRLKGFNNSEFPLEAIYRLLPGTSESRRQLFETEGEVVQTGGDIAFSYRLLPYSRAVETETGVCAERSILLQLSQQGKLPIFLATGLCKIGDEHAYHAFNIALKDGQVVLVDVKPRESRNGRYNPFIVPVKGIDIANQSVVLPENLSDGRKYSITHLDEIF